MLPGGRTLTEETRWLRQVAAAYRSEPVQAVTAQVADSALTRPEGTLR